MRLTPIYGLPIAEENDARRQFPLDVDGPRTEAIEAELSRLAGGGPDTGWRDVSDVLINGWEGSVYARRLGRTVWVTVAVVKATANGPFQITGPAPAGFGPNIAGVFVPMFDPASGTLPGHALGNLSAATWLYVAPPADALYPAGQALYGVLNELTDAPWPSTLPGTPVALLDPGLLPAPTP